MKVVVPPQANSIETLVNQFELAQEEAVARYDGLMEAARNLQQQRNLFEEVIENSRDAIFVVESDSGIIVHVNEAAEVMLGYPVEDLKGRRQITLFPEDSQDGLKAKFREVQETGGISIERAQLQCADGTLVDVSISANVLTGDFEGLTVGFARDISAQVQVEEDLRALNETLEKRVEERTEEIRFSNEELEKTIQEANRNTVEAEEANKAKSVFIANMTHEIRTPLNAVTGMLDLLMDMDLGDEEKETVEVVSRSATILGTVINDILDFSKIEAGKLELENVVFDLPELLVQVQETFAFQAREKGLKLELEQDKDLPEFVVGDPGRLRQVLINLLGNALKFTEKGSVNLEVRQISLEGHRHSIKFSVQDTGVGIPEASQKKMFEPFTQVDATTSRKYGGTGLGLNIANKLVEKMGGQLEVESWVGQGSTFFFTAHLGRATNIQVKQIKENGVKTKSRKSLVKLDTDALKILLVEDNKLNQRVALGMLAKLKCRADSAENGFEALDRLNEEEYDLVFMDLQMPGMDGLETTRRIREGEGGENNRSVPVIAMTAHASREDRKACLAVGMNDYIAKPISTDLISEAMKRILVPELNQEKVADDDAFTMKPLISKSDGDVEIAAEVLDLFMTEARKRLNLIIGALQHYDFNFAAQEAKALEGKALAIDSAAVVGLANDLAKAADQKQQDFGLELAEEIRDELNKMETVI